jgi:hypothetical protein
MKDETPRSYETPRLGEIQRWLNEYGSFKLKTNVPLA